MKWDSNNPGGTGNGRRPHDGWMAQFLRREAEKQAEMIVQIRERAQKRLDAKPADMPDKETMRAARFAQDGFKHLAELELEAAKVSLLAQRVGGAPPVPTEVLVARLRHEFTLAAGTFDETDMEILARNLSPEAWVVLDRVRAERFGAGQWVTATEEA